MSITIKSTADIAKKWAEVTPGRQTYYQQGVANAGPTWEKGATDAAAAFDAAVKAGNIKQLFVGGIKKAGGAKYQDMAVNKGAGRFSDGVTKGAPYFQTGFDPYQAVIAGITLQARAPRGSASNYQRVTQVASALNQKRLALRAAGA
jgi:hypothetical protein